MNRETTDFIWENKKHDFNQDILMTNTGNGGLGLTNISLKVQAQRVMWLKTVLSYGKDDFTRKFVEFNLGKNDGYLGLDILQAKVDKVKFTTNKDPFYKNMLKAWSEIDVSHDLPIQSQYYYHNSNILGEIETLYQCIIVWQN